MTQTVEVKVALVVQAQMQAARRALDDLAAKLAELGPEENDASEAMQRLAQAVNAVASAGSATGSSSASLREQTESLREQTESLREQAPLFGKNANEARRYKDALAGVRQFIAELRKQMAQQGESSDGTAARIDSMPRALARASTSAARAFGLVAGVLVTVAAAWAGVEREQAAYSASLVATNNAQGLTIDRLRDTARSVSAVEGTTGAAARALAKLAVTGRVGGQELQGAATIAVRAQRLLGREVGDTVRIYADLGRDPVQALLKLNEGTNFLTSSVLRQVRAYLDLGDQQAAAALAQRAWSEQQQRVLDDAQRNLGTLARGWQAVAAVAKGAWDAMLDVGRPKTLADKIAGLQADLDRLQNEPRRGGTMHANDTRDRAIRAVNARLTAALRRALREQENADAEGLRTRQEQRRVEIQNYIAGLTQTLKTNREKFEAEKKKLDEALSLGEIQKGQYDKLLSATREKYHDRTPAGKPDPAVTAFEQQRLALTQQLAVAEQKLANEVFGVGLSQETATARLDAWLATSGKAEKLDAARAQQLRNLAAGLDRVAAEQGRVAEAAKRRERIDAGMQGVDAELARATGQSVDAAIAEAKKRYAKLRQDLAASGGTEGVLKIDKLIDMTAARAELEQLRREVDLIFGAQGRDQQTVQAEITAGLTSEYEGRQRLLDINTRTVAGVDALLPRMRELAKLTGDPQMDAGIADLEARIGLMKLRADELKLSFTSAFTAGLGNAIAGLANQTQSLGEAVRGFIAGLAQSMAQFAANKLAEQATGALMGGIDKTLKAVNELIPSFGKAAAAKVAADRSMTASGVASTTEAAAAASVAGVEVAAANAPAAAATATWSWGAAAAAGLAALVAIYAMAKGFDKGGYTGPGGKHQPAGIVHAGEVVVRQSVVRQPGMKELLLDINKRGAVALQGPLRWPGFAEGGLVMPAAGAAPSAAEFPVLSKGSGTSVRLRTVNVLDPALFDDYARSAPGEKTFLNFIRRNGTAVRAAMDGR